MPRRRVTNFGLPSDLSEMVDVVLRDAPGMGYASRTDVVKAALRLYLTHLVEMKVLPPHAFTPGFAGRRKPSPETADLARSRSRGDVSV